jgi:hypothetical protein
MPKTEVAKEMPKWENTDASSEVAREAFKKTIEEAIKAHTHDRRDEQKPK